MKAIVKGYNKPFINSGDKNDWIDIEIRLDQKGLLDFMANAVDAVKNKQTHSGFAMRFDNIVLKSFPIGKNLDGKGQIVLTVS